jgi:hypothetical protein
MAASTPRRSTGTKRTASAVKKRKSSGSSGRAARFVVCLSNAGFPSSLEVRKIYRAMPDAAAKKVGMVRVVDESGEDYLYPEARFGQLELPRNIARALAT